MVLPKMQLSAYEGYKPQDFSFFYCSEKLEQQD